MTAPTKGAVASGKPATKGSTLFSRALRTKSTVIGVILTALIVAIAVIGPFVSPHTPTEFVGAPFSPRGPGMLFGTDAIGRDVWSRFLHGGFLLLFLSLLATLIGVGVGAAVGVIAAYRHGFVDEVLMRAGDTLLAFPQIVLALLFLSIVGPKAWLLVVMVAFGHLPRVARVIRGAAVPVVERDFVRSAEAVGVPRWRILLTEVVPNVTGTLAVELGLRLTYSIGLIAGLSFLGMGMQPPTADWGLMINENRIALTVQPWPVVLPVVAIAILTVGTNLVTEGLARASAGAGVGVEE